MQNQAITTLEFDRLKDTLLQQIRTPLGASLAEELQISTDAEEIRRELRLTGEGVLYLRDGTALDINDLPDPRQPLGKLGIQDVNLEPVEILDLLRLISVASGLRETFHEEANRFPLIREITEQIPNLRALYQRLRGRIGPTGEVEDFASPELREVRFQMSKLRSQIQRSLETILKRAEEDHALRDDYVTVRNDRYVIPIRNDNRGAVQGVVHGMSSSGQTAFIEPLETINLNNDLVRLRELEQTEIIKVLFAITEELRDEREALWRMADAVAAIDFIAAKARLAIAHDAIEPTINQNGKLHLKNARHPLLESHLKSQRLPIVPLSLDLDAEHRVMVISGPNAGGKTVVLKTVGLLSLMAQAGLHVPATEADLPIFNQALADIGDHQSIAANLSTFTAHIQNIRNISDKLEPPALILLDEVGTGTDPEEGSALGVAMVDYFRERGAHIIVTTHYSGLKIYATNTPGVLNASVEFDERTLKPTYHLLVGLAGSSSGIEIARRFGLPKGITERAAERVKTASADATEYLRRLKDQFDHQQQTVAALEEERAIVADKYAKLEIEFIKREKEREKEFRAELQKIVDQFATKAEQFASTIEDAATARKVRKEIERRTIEMKTAASTASRELRQKHGITTQGEQAPAESVEEAAPEITDFQVGDRVRVLSLGQDGVIEAIKDEEIVVQIGALRFREQADNLRFVERKAANQKTAKAVAGLPKGVSVSLKDQKSVGSELNVIGKTANEATYEADKFLDEAYLDNHDRVRIVHGVGLGALKRAIATLLSGHPHVAKFYPAEQSEGGNGATIVELKK
ncbi:MAG TPA: endonuclease MutS2 [Blastocatellia bacterium]|nr:endonuclease MutS2 [Blastocatellia bacterium]HMX27122.1 endonuclease MutS2 [Blastocatellia bacterium]HMY73064.1 endonuclease MutS2 [Blastocatellia bacterium]HMZ19569.1 endonuclease MutS2 [Blastocatellia bacterium]HNG32886.1 endonuclease MutS2 [Blastocatellia bacterium]